MSDYLTVEKAINRDTSGNLIPDDIIVECWPTEEKPKVRYLPMSKGKFQEVYGSGKTSKDQDKQMIFEHIVYPKFNDKTFSELSLAKITAFLIAIISGSTGRSQDYMQKVMEENQDKIIDKVNEDFLKKKDSKAKTT
jgi:hypothetical protein